MMFRKAILILALLVPFSCLAEYIPPGEVEIKTKATLPETNQFAQGTYKYSVSWQGIPVGSAELIVQDFYAARGRYIFVAAKAKTASAISLLYKLRHRSESLFRADTFQPSSFSVDQKENSRKKVRKVVFSKDGTIRSRTWQNGKEKQEIVFTSDNYTFDPVSAAFLARGQHLEVGATTAVDVFTGKHRYLISFLVEKKEKVWVNRKPIIAYKVVPTVKKLTDSEGEKKLQSATLWISADGRRDIVKMASEVWIGSVTVELDGFYPDEVEDITGSIRARLNASVKESSKAPRS